MGKKDGIEGDDLNLDTQGGELVKGCTQLRDMFSTRQSAKMAMKNHQLPILGIIGIDVQLAVLVLQGI